MRRLSQGWQAVRRTAEELAAAPEGMSLINRPKGTFNAHDPAWGRQLRLELRGLVAAARDMLTPADMEAGWWLWKGMELQPMVAEVAKARRVRGREIDGRTLCQPLPPPALRSHNHAPSRVRPCPPGEGAPEDGRTGPRAAGASGGAPGGRPRILLPGGPGAFGADSTQHTRPPTSSLSELKPSAAADPDGRRHRVRMSVRRTWRPRRRTPGCWRASGQPQRP